MASDSQPARPGEPVDQPKVGTDPDREHRSGPGLEPEGDLDQVDQPTPAQARAALEALEWDNSKLARRVATPNWYHPLMAVIVAVFVIAQVMPTPVFVVVTAVGVAALGNMVTVYRQRYGVLAAGPVGAKARWLLFGSMGVYLLAAAAGQIIKLAHVPHWWVLAPAVIASGAMLIAGPRYDNALRAELGGKPGGAA
ncbi:MAG: hypothetical protein LBC97_05685 [Bifidobacteriaceae bacterium]|jgi:hypothetical protein|nr:hypothetical protein [Bifidobacteriaceae bacterium]